MDICFIPFEEWTYILHNKNNIVKELTKAFLDSHCIESYLQKLYANLNDNEFVIILFITSYFRFFF
jgi:hypothetical protein